MSRVGFCSHAVKEKNKSKKHLKEGPGKNWRLGETALSVAHMAFLGAVIMAQYNAGVPMTSHLLVPLIVGALTAKGLGDKVTHTIMFSCGPLMNIPETISGSIVIMSMLCQLIASNIRTMLEHFPIIFHRPVGIYVMLTGSSYVFGMFCICHGMSVLYPKTPHKAIMTVHVCVHLFARP